MAEYVPVKDLDELLSARAAGILWYADAPESAMESVLLIWWGIAVENELEGRVGGPYILPNDWSVLVEDGDDE